MVLNLCFLALDLTLQLRYDRVMSCLESSDILLQTPERDEFVRPEADGGGTTTGRAVVVRGRASGSAGQRGSSIRSSTRQPNSRASTGTRSSMPWNSEVNARSAGRRMGAKP